MEDPQEADMVDVLDAPLTCNEIRFQMGRLPANSAPGPDGITYRTWKTLDPKGKLLNIIYSMSEKGTSAGQLEGKHHSPCVQKQGG